MKGLLFNFRSALLELRSNPGFAAIADSDAGTRNWREHGINPDSSGEARAECRSRCGLAL
jgi:hypothetical protein